ncbi:TusE/DsrC/DsvC family sulfur relay protein [Thiorhodovibrio litoralis]|uniref:TusE/DsrC/DsvC family sulfur relay protein n=2 Tax=Thiorhodovibrio TaxID=61593 RepID=UPI002B256A56|nr:TusE/DsrC/DsvC family sulfur relay protein [Thiorhodovibrio litoralis]
MGQTDLNPTRGRSLMPVLRNLNAEDFDERGFVRVPERWNAPLAQMLAREHGVQLTDEHWRVIANLRKDYFATSSLPVEHSLCAALNLKIDCLARLFGGPLTAWMIAGLPDPGVEARTYMENLEVPAPDPVGQGAPDDLRT